MKKIIMGVVMLLALCILGGCTKVEESKYKEGTYYGYDEVGKSTAVIYIDEQGVIKSVFIDAAYLGKDTESKPVATTKQILGNAYGMKGKGSPVATYEWYEQANKLADKVVSEQGLDWFVFKYRVIGTDGKATYTETKPADQTEDAKTFTDAVSGVTIHVDSMYKALKSALDKATNYLPIED